MNSLKKVLLLVFLTTLLTGTALALACSGTKDFSAQYGEVKGLQPGSPEKISALNEIKTGTALEIQDQQVERKAESVPVVIKLKVSPESKGKIYYALATKEKYFTAEDYDGLSLFNWVDGLGTNIVDGLKKGLIAKNCSEWKNKKDTLIIDLSNYSTQQNTQEIDLFTATAMPRGTYLAILCAPAETKVKAYYFDGTKKTYNTGKGIFNGGEQLMVPIGQYSNNTAYSYGTGNEFTTKTIEQIKEKKACIEESNGKKYVKWNLSGMLEEILATSQNIPWKEQQEEKQGSNQGEKPPAETGGTGQTGCTPKTCSQMGWECGTGKENKCNNTINCGQCNNGTCQNHKCTAGKTPEQSKLTLKDVYFTPQHPTEQDTKYLKCIAEAIIPPGNQKEITYHFTWKVDGKKFFEKSYTKPANTTSMYTQLEGHSLKTGQKYECIVTVSDGETTTEPKTAETTIEKEKSIGQGSGEEPDKDGDGFPDSVDKCPNQPAPNSNNGCPTTQQQKQTCKDNTENGKCSTNKPKYCNNGALIDKCTTCGCPSGEHCNKSTEKCKTNCKEEWICIENNTKEAHRLKDCSLTDQRTCAYGCENGQCKTRTGGTEACTPKTCSQMGWECGTGKENKCNNTINCGQCNNRTCQNHKCIKNTGVTLQGRKLTFLAVPANWSGTDESFKNTVKRNFEYFLEKSGLEKCKQNYTLKFILPSQAGPAECPGLEKINCFYQPTFWAATEACIQKKLGSSFSIMSDNSITIVGTNTGLEALHKYRNPSTGQISFRCTQGLLGMGEWQFVNGVRMLPQMLVFETTPIPVLAHETGHQLHFCEQYSMYDHWVQDMMLKQHRVSRGCTDEYPGYFEANQNGPVRLSLDPNKMKKCSSREVPCPLVWAQESIRNISRQSKGTYSICQQSGQTNCVLFPHHDCPGRMIFNSSGTHIGFGIMGGGGFTNFGQEIVRQNNQKQGYLFGFKMAAGSYFDCMEKKVFKENWGCNK